ncbi:MAG: hypothetical protein QOG85_1768 [Gaiellaceae bacterium]|jgi:uncharacterized membrane protein YqjE|nr:hypothetical protein [Gaiellaceae bacterium]
MDTIHRNGNGNGEALRDRGTGELMKQLSGQVSTLMRQEVELAKAELAEKGKKAGVAAGAVGGAAVAGFYALGSLTAFLILVLSLAIPAWVAALIVTVCWAAIAGVLAARARERVQAMGKPIPEKTVETLKEDVQWLKDRN